MVVNIKIPGTNGKLASLVRNEVANNDDFNEIELTKCDFDCAVVDFTTPENTIDCLQNLSYKVYVIGTTGFTESQEAIIKCLSKHKIIIKSPNFSESFSYFDNLTTRVLNEFGGDVSIREFHGVHKKDMPSGTAKHLAENLYVENDKITSFRSRYLEKQSQHMVQYTNGDEVITLTHFINDSKVFAKGALQAADEYITLSTPGLYTW